MGDLSPVSEEGRGANLPAPTSLSPYVGSVEVARQQANAVRSKLSEISKAPKCDDCSCFREAMTKTQRMNHRGDYEPMNTRMCAHPAYSVLAVDHTRARMDFMPKFTVEEARSEEALCGPTGRLYVSSQPPVHVRVGSVALRELRENVWTVLSWSLVFLVIYLLTRG